MSASQPSGGEGHPREARVARGAPTRSVSPGPSQSLGIHVGTIAHEGLLWDTYLEFADDPKRPLSFRGRLRFDRAAGPDGAGESAHTAVIIIEESYEEAVAKARSMDERQLAGLLRSALP